MSNWVTQMISTLGYVGIGFLMFLENLFPPIPSELIMPLAGFTVAQGKMNFALVLLAGVVGTLLGALPWYFAGRLLGGDRLKALADRYGKWLTLSGDDIDQSTEWFRKHGNKAVLLGRLVPGVRTLISVPAGTSEMPFVPFLLYSLLGSLAWTSLLTFAGYTLGQNYTLVERYIGPLSKIVLIVLPIAFGVWIVKRKRQQKRSRTNR